MKKIWWTWSVIWRKNSWRDWLLYKTSNGCSKNQKRVLRKRCCRDNESHAYKCHEEIAKCVYVDGYDCCQSARGVHEARKENNSWVFSVIQTEGVWQELHVAKNGRECSFCYEELSALFAMEYDGVGTAQRQLLDDSAERALKSVGSFFLTSA